MLLGGMRVRKVGALIKVAMRGPARYAILTTEGDLRLVLSADAVRQPLALDSPAVGKPEVAMATALIDAIGIDSRSSPTTPLRWCRRSWTPRLAARPPRPRPSRWLPLMT